MSDQTEHTPTDRENQLYQALTNGDRDAVEASRNRAKDDDAWREDYRWAWRRYQRDNEPSEKQREKLTRQQAREQNHEAMEGM